jgi:polysaccharide biosynthesis protein PelD
MSDRALRHTDAALGDERRWAWHSQLRLGIEFLVLFALSLLIAHAMPSGTSGTYPHPLWLPVIVLSLQHGTLAGMTAAVAASGLFLSEGLPPAVLSEDLYQYTGRIFVEPIGWTCAALLIGHLRDRQIRERSELRAELAERDQHCRAVAELCDDLRKRAEMLERHIAANAISSHADIVEAVCSLHESDSTNFTDRLSRFILLMTGASEFALYLLQDNELRIAIDVPNEHSNPADMVIPAHDSLFEAVVNSRKTLLSVPLDPVIPAARLAQIIQHSRAPLVLAARAADGDLLNHRGTVIGPLLDRSSHQVIGMLRIGGGNLVDFPEDIERKFTLACSEISRLLGRTIFINSPDATLAFAVRPIGRLKRAPSLARRRLPTKTDARELETG